jgi:outer membrane receptor for ferric coprogen and ferric-rhodotorulic acid
VEQIHSLYGAGHRPERRHHRGCRHQLQPPAVAAHAARHPRYADGKAIDLPRSTFTGARWSRAETDVTTYYLDLEHRFNEDWAFKAAAVRMDEVNTSTHQRVPVHRPGRGGGRQRHHLRRLDHRLPQHQAGPGHDLVGHFDTGPWPDESPWAATLQMTSDDAYWRNFDAGGNIFDIDHDRPEPSRGSLLAKASRAPTRPAMT